MFRGIGGGAKPTDSPDFAALALVQSPVSPDYPMCQREKGPSFTGRAYLGG